MTSVTFSCDVAHVGKYPRKAVQWGMASLKGRTARQSASSRPRILLIQTAVERSRFRTADILETTGNIGFPADVAHLRGSYEVDGFSFAQFLLARFYLYVHFRIVVQHIFFRAISAKPEVFNYESVFSGCATRRRSGDPNQPAFSIIEWSVALRIAAFLDHSASPQTCDGIFFHPKLEGGPPQSVARPLNSF
jgi:hypothetical protein